MWHIIISKRQFFSYMPTAVLTYVKKRAKVADFLEKFLLCSSTMHNFASSKR